MRTTRLAIAVVAVVYLTACAGVQQKIVTDSIYISNAVSLTLPAPGEIEPEIYATQTLSGRYENESFDLQLRLELRRDAIVVAAFSHFGNTLFSMSYDGHSITTIGKAFMLMIPVFLGYTIPIACLIAVILAFSRFSADNDE